MKTADALFESIDMHIIKRLSPDIVLGRRPDTENLENFTLITPIEDRTLIIDYREDPESSTRTITELRVLRE